MPRRNIARGLLPLSDKCVSFAQQAGSIAAIEIIGVADPWIDLLADIPAVRPPAESGRSFTRYLKCYCRTISATLRHKAPLAR
jgi:hypothetical protein